MPKNYVTDPITDQEIAFAHLLLSEKMNDREAAEAAGLSTTTAAYTKAKPRVRQYMDAHRAAVNEKLVDEEVQGLRKLNLGRDQILSRLWQLASLDPEVTKGSISGQIKAMAMIVAIEGLLPERHPASSPRSASPLIQPAESTPVQQSVTATQAKPVGPPPTATSSAPAQDTYAVNRQLTHKRQINPFIDPNSTDAVPDAIGLNLAAISPAASSLRLPLAAGTHGR